MPYAVAGAPATQRRAVGHTPSISGPLRTGRTGDTIAHTRFASATLVCRLFDLFIEYSTCWWRCFTRPLKEEPRSPPHRFACIHTHDARPGPGLYAGDEDGLFRTHAAHSLHAVHSTWPDHASSPPDGTRMHPQNPPRRSKHPETTHPSSVIYGVRYTAGPKPTSRLHSKGTRQTDQASNGLAWSYIVSHNTALHHRDPGGHGVSRFPNPLTPSRTKRQTYRQPPHTLILFTCSYMTLLSGNTGPCGHVYDQLLLSCLAKVWQFPTADQLSATEVSF